MKVVVVLGGIEDDPWHLPASVVSDSTWVFGGERTLYEVAVAAASLGHDVELRGHISGKDLEEVARWGGGRPRMDLEPRRPDEGDIVIVPEGVRDPLFFARISLSPARAIMCVLAAPGLFGPAILPGFVPQDALEVDPVSVSLPEQYRAIRDCGFELWANSRGICADAGRAGVECSFMETGQSIPFPDPGRRTHDIAYYVDNRWMPLAREVATRLRASVLEIARSPRSDAIQEMAKARILIHAPVVEGQGRIQLEARAVGTVPVSLRSNRFVEGQEEGGGVLVDSLDEMVSEVERLLANPSELEELSRVALTSAREQMDWPTFVRRAGSLLSAPAPPDPMRALRARLGEAVEQGFTELRERRRQVAGLERGVAWLSDQMQQRDGETERMRSEIGWLRSVIERTEADRDEAAVRADALERRRSVRLADWAGRLVPGRRGRRRRPRAGE